MAPPTTPRPEPTVEHADGGTRLHRRLRASVALIAAVLVTPILRAGPSVATWPPEQLRGTGLYADWPTRTVASDNLPFTPQYPLWSDGATKQRWLHIPRGAFIDASNPDVWRFPIGARLWKEFRFGRRVETRFIEHTRQGWRFASYVWNEAESEAVLVPEAGIRQSAMITDGVRHAIPSRQDCRACHEAGPVRVLGVSALQLSPDRDPVAVHAERPDRDAVDLTALMAHGLVRGLPAGMLSSPPRIMAPTPVARAALGYQNYNGTVKQVGRLIETFHRVADANRDKMELALTAPDVRRIVASGRLAVILGIESGFDQEGDVDVLRLWYRLGVRLIQFPAQVTTAYGDATGRGAPRWGGINDRGRHLIAEMNRLGIIIDVTHATEAAQRQIIEASRAPVVASHVAVRAVCDNPANMPDDIVRAIATKGGLVGIHSNAVVISQRYFDYSRTHAVGTALAGTLIAAVDQEPRLVRPRDPDNAEYIDAVDARLGDLWRQFYVQPWRADPVAELLEPTADEWAEHVVHAMRIGGPSAVAIGLDMTQGRSTLRDFDARSYGQLVDALRKRNVPSQVLGENWLRVMEAARVQ